MTVYNIDIVSDTVCPWCYVGYTRLDAAIKLHKETYPNDTFNTTWNPYQLNPELGKGIDKKQFWDSKFGAQRFEMMKQRLSRMGEPTGIQFAFGGKTGNTRDSHRLLELAGTKGPEMQTKVAELLFKGYWEEEDDISSEECLIARGVKAGLDEAEAREYMESGKGDQEVESAIRAQRWNLLSGVPRFDINGQVKMQGAEETDSFVRAFAKIKNRGGANAGGSNCTMC